MKKILTRIMAYFKTLFSPVDRESGTAGLVDTMRIFNAIFIIRVFGLIVNILTLPARVDLPEGLYLMFQYAFYPLFGYNLLLFFFQKKVYTLLKKQSLWILVDIAVSVGVLFIGAGWRSSYFAYTISTLMLATLFAQAKGTLVSCLILGLVALFKDPNIYGHDMLIFNATSLDMRLGAALFYVVAGLILAYFNHLLHRIQKLSEEKIEAVKKAAAAEQKMRLAADLHDNVKSKITAILLLYRPLLKKLFAIKSVARDDLLKLWKWLNYLQEDTLKLFASLKPGYKLSSNGKRLDLIGIINEELRIMAEITDFRWDFVHDRKALEIPTAKIQAVRRFLGEAVLNSWKHSGVKDGMITLHKRQDGVQLVIRDGGRGFKTLAHHARFGHGLASMQRRAEELQGNLDLATGDGRGVTLTLTFPL